MDDGENAFDVAIQNAISATRERAGRLAGDESVEVFSRGQLLTWNGEELPQLTLSAERFRIEIHLGGGTCLYSTCIELFGDVRAAEQALVLMRLSDGTCVVEAEPEEEPR